MKIDVVTIFPDYLAPLDLSLIGKARAAGTIELAVHDLRDWTTDRHRTVDGTPAGGGAGMVMRPDVWGAALDEISGEDTVLLVPTPSGEPFTQRLAEDLAGERHLLIACGRYEGIDARVAEHYASRRRVVEFSIGDYVLNGGEAAALVAIEAIGRLVPGVVGNPDSLIEESHGAAGLLEYPVYTRPVTWRDASIPDVLLGGDHVKIAAWRRAQALSRTARRRPDMLVNRAEPLTMADRLALIDAGYAVCGDAVRPCRIRAAETGDAAALADLAARTFPDACPPELPPSARAEFVARYLTADSFARYLADDDRRLWVAEIGGRAHAYAMVVLGLRPEDEEGASAVRHHLPRGRLAEVSKFYADDEVRGTGLARALMRRVLVDVARLEPRPAGLWLGTNRSNIRAVTFYERCGWKVTGSRTFDVGGQPQDDVIITVPKLAKYARDVTN